MHLARTAIYCILVQSILCVHAGGGEERTPTSSICTLVDLSKFDSALKAKKLSENDIQEYFTVMDSGCASVVEVAEWSNELLFHMMEIEMDAFLKMAGSKATSNHQRAFIIAQIENPIHDNIPLARIQAILGKSPYAKSKFGKKVEQALRVATRKSE